MRKYLHLFLFLAVLLTACANNNNNGLEEAVDGLTPSTTEIISAIDWEKPLFSIDDHGDTITRCIYDEKGRLSKILTDYDDNGIPGCVTTYTYDGNKAHVTYSCDPGYEEDIVYADASCTKILEESGQIYEYDELGRISKIIIGNNEITYDYTVDEETGIVHAEISGNYLINQGEDRDEYGRLVYESHVNDLDIYTTTYTYEGNVCRARVENTIYVKDEFGGIPDLDDVFTDTYEYFIYY